MKLSAAAATFYLPSDDVPRSLPVNKKGKYDIYSTIVGDISFN